MMKIKEGYGKRLRVDQQVISLPKANSATISSSAQQGVFS
jgi:hypothetical protein